ncbi:MAG TPA: alanine racemase [Terriglobales bacterium]|nr:alanine racemase [Terriglobales bacterium]
MRPIWAEISRSALRHNLKAIRQHIGDKITICAVVKADAYGHGSVGCARVLEAEGVDWFGVTGTEEGVRLREGGIRGRVLLLSGFWQGEAEEVIHQRLTPAAYDLWQIAALEQAAAKLNLAEPFRFHLKIDTGMSRLGINMNDLPKALEQIRQSPHLKFEGAFSHLASAEVLDSAAMAEQEANFDYARETIVSYGLNPGYLHLANTSGMIGRPEARFNMVRPGLALYGYTLPFIRNHAPATILPYVDLKPALSWKTRIVSLRDLPSGRSVGYGGTYVTTRSTRIGVLPVGYADGLNRALSGKGCFHTRGHKVPILGRVSMDLTVVDVTDIPEAALGDEVCLIGGFNGCSVTAWDHAKLAHTIPYEILCNISKRVLRQLVD